MYPVTRPLVPYPDLSTIYRRDAHEHGLITYATKCTDGTIDPSLSQPPDATFASLCIEGKMHAMAIEALLHWSVTRPRNSPKTHSDISEIPYFWRLATMIKGSTGDESAKLNRLVEKISMGSLLHYFPSTSP